MCAPRLLFLLPVVEAGDEEEHGDREGNLSVKDRVDVDLHHSVHNPDRTSDKPDPGCFSHCFELDAVHRAWVSSVARAGCGCDGVTIKYRQRP